MWPLPNLNKLKRTILKDSRFFRYLHTAVIVSGTMLVFGGNTHNDTSMSHGAKCFSSDFMAYDIGKFPKAILASRIVFIHNLHFKRNRKYLQLIVVKLFERGPDGIFNVKLTDRNILKSITSISDSFKVPRLMDWGDWALLCYK